MQFSHLHCHTQYSLLDGASKISGLFAKAKADNMPAVAITDHGNMFGAFQFVAEASKHEGVKPIVGCEFYVVEDRFKKQFSKEQKDKRYHQLMLAKNAEGYANLVKLCSLGFIEGLYGKYPRIDKSLILQYHKGLIATTCCIGASVPQAILRGSEEEAEKEFKWWLDIFGEDYYVEVQNHQIPDQLKCNEVLLKFAKKYNVKVIASNDSHYLDQKDANAHDILLCINTGEKQATPTYKDVDDGESVKGKRFAFYNDEFYFKNTQEMTKLWSHIPEAIDNTNEIVGKIDTLRLKQDIMLPNYEIPQGFVNQDDYLEHLTWEGARKRYGEAWESIEVKDRLSFELHTIRTMGFAGYFLIVSDFIRAGRELGVFVGPGRGSAAGSVVAYCIGITNIDPIKYNLLFERFLNPDRKSMPDIDTDFDDEGRQKVIDYVVEKYGKQQVAHIVTYGTMAAKMSIKDVARVMDLPLNESNELAKLVPDKPGTNLNRVMNAPLIGEKSLAEKEQFQAEDIENVKKLREIRREGSLRSKVLEEALVLEGSVRGTGIHAAGIIIAPKDLTEILPVYSSKEVNLLITQFEGKIIEDAGVIKMDFLGLKTLSILKEALRLIKQNHGIDIDLDNIPLDDVKTYELYQRGETNATFQFESAGMQKHLLDLKPDQFSDLIAMNALYRPGPIAYIPNFIARKHGREEIAYDLPDMEEYLADTYGITVYQEQVMLLSQKLAGFSKGDADVLRKAMGKKDRYTLDKMKSKFVDGAKEKGHPEDKLNKIWTDWEAFAQYAFNKSHSTCYAFVAYQTGYLKAHYPSEYMAAVMSNSLGNIDKITFFMEECRRMGLPVLGPDINESYRSFAVNKKGEIRFGLGAIKGTGDAAVESIIEERDKNGAYKDIFDFVKRVNLRTVNKKTLESLAYGGGFDCFDNIHRAVYFADVEGSNFIEKIIRYANKAVEVAASAQGSLFGMLGDGGGGDLATPKIPLIEKWGQMEKLKFEKEVVGIYISGHPLDEYRLELESFCSCTLDRVMEPIFKGKEVSVGGIVTKVVERYSKNGNPFMLFTLEDYNGSYEFALFGEDFVNLSKYIATDRFLYIKGQIKNRWGRPDEWEFKPVSIRLLSEIRNLFSKELKISIGLQLVNSIFIDQLNKLVSQNQGTCNLSVMVYDPEDKVEVTMLSRKNKISPSNEFLNELQLMQGVTYKLN
ncbi:MULTISPECIES: DNA polymerase III subunit alpha [unclassified Arcicella]|uniref:DNA polymerase III subunit alpha n=1 Tax=unclassified Arcicella TaxID=2644986 RepID=UPI002866ED2C|nr:MULTISPECIES: DNA polymerase III subunit alpha [unclassified Arcicella]MDR6561807.1 DNA polymerase-3 subunit alpha [Arcicella sp. BE51]MDR6813953.1 DNA polymerase-3 subunit alpha [Arcicella sp. BE140]MDR6825340.1 DNA polymerase-3 subunit alpha [Arcicella sp. BE139]